MESSLKTLQEQASKPRESFQRYNQVGEAPLSPHRSKQEERKQISIERQKWKKRETQAKPQQRENNFLSRLSTHSLSQGALPLNNAHAPSNDYQFPVHCEDDLGSEEWERTCHQLDKYSILASSDRQALRAMTHFTRRDMHQLTLGWASRIEDLEAEWKRKQSSE